MKKATKERSSDNTAYSNAVGEHEDAIAAVRECIELVVSL